MQTEIIVALIGAGAVILAAIIATLTKSRKGRDTTREGINLIIVIEMPKQENDINELTSKLSKKEYSLIEPKNFDGSELIQALIRISEITIPLIFAYLMATKKKNTITLKYRGKVDIEITSELHKLDPDADAIMSSLKRMLNEIENSDENEANS